MTNKNNKQTLNKRTHNPLGIYNTKSKEASSSNNSTPNDGMKEELSAEFSERRRKK